MSTEPNLCQWCRMPAHGGACDREQLKRVIHELRAMEAARAKIPGANVIMIRSLISHRNQKPRIDIQVGEIHTQMDADSAMDVAKNIIECCQGAYADAFVFHFVHEKLNQPGGIAAQIIEDFREFRDELAREFRELQQRPDEEN